MSSNMENALKKDIFYFTISLVVTLFHVFFLSNYFYLYYVNIILLWINIFLGYKVIYTAFHKNFSKIQGINFFIFLLWILLSHNSPSWESILFFISFFIFPFFSILQKTVKESFLWLGFSAIMSFIIFVLYSWDDLIMLALILFSLFSFPFVLILIWIKKILGKCKK